MFHLTTFNDVMATVVKNQGSLSVGDTLWRCRQKVLIIVNPKSRRNVAIKRAVLVANELALLGNQVVIVSSTKNGQIIYEPDPSTFKLVVIAGGDGTISMFLSAYHRKKLPPIGLIPAGTTNEFANQYGINERNFLNVIKDNHKMNCDISVVNDERVAIYSVAAGKFTNATYGASQRAKNIFGQLAYVMYGLTHHKQKAINVIADIGNYRYNFGQCIFWGFTNSMTIGGGLLKMQIKPGDLVDGKNEFFIAKQPKLGFLGYLSLYYDTLRGKVFNNKLTQKHQSQTVKLNFFEDGFINIDGEEYHHEGTINIKVLHGALQILAPKSIYYNVCEFSE